MRPTCGTPTRTSPSADPRARRLPQHGGDRLSRGESRSADAIHPGYGFLSENAYFADILQDGEVTFIGPPPEAIRLMGDEGPRPATVRRSAGLDPCRVAGVVESVDDAAAVARKVGYPVILGKARPGGGGGGMRVARDDRELSDAFETARMRPRRRSATAASISRSTSRVRATSSSRSSPTSRARRAPRRARLLGAAAPPEADRGVAVARCSTPALRATMGDGRGRRARPSATSNAGTVEFLLDTDGKFYFMEMNTRLQVEHPVTEMVTGLRSRQGADPRRGRRTPQLPGGAQRAAWPCDRVPGQRGGPLPELPALPGHITAYHPPGGPGVRVDTHVYAGYNVPPYYDSLLAKVIVWGRDREEAIGRGRRALDFFVIEGIKTTIPLHRRILDDPDFIAGKLDHFHGAVGMAAENRGCSTAGVTHRRATSSRLRPHRPRRERR